MTPVGRMSDAEWFRRRCLIRGLALEISGEVRPSTPSCLQVIRSAYGIKGTPQQVYERFIHATRELFQEGSDDGE